MHHIDGAQPIPGGEHAVERTRRTAPLDMTQNYGAGLKARALLDFLRQSVANSPEPLVSELILAKVAHHQPRRARSRELGALGCDYDAEVPAASMSLAN